MAEYVFEIDESRADAMGNMPCERHERVVRCRDCAYSEPCPLVGTEKLVCNFLDEMLVNPDGFCAWGFPRNGASDD